MILSSIISFFVLEGKNDVSPQHKFRGKAPRTFCRSTWNTFSFRSLEKSALIVPRSSFPAKYICFSSVSSANVEGIVPFNLIRRNSRTLSRDNLDIEEGIDTYVSMLSSGLPLKESLVMLGFNESMNDISGNSVPCGSAKGTWRLPSKLVLW